jgi:VWFA-related protein
MAREAATAVYYVDAVGLDGLTPTPGQSLVPVFGEAWARSGGAQDLATFTGGFTSRLSNDITTALNRVGEEMRTYYIVGYVPPRPSDGEFREVEVEVDVPGLEARTKKGYLAGIKRY